MGVNQGFDIIPRLRDNPEDNAIWARFLEDVLKEYCLDSKLLNDPSRPFIMFNIGEGPQLERDAWRFRRFSSKIVRKDMGDYLDSVTRIAQRHLGGRVYAWSESFDYAWPYYDWREIYALREGKEEELPGRYIDRDDKLVHVCHMPSPSFSPLICSGPGF